LVFFLDTSALVKIYLDEVGTPQILTLLESEEDELIVLSLTEVEFRAAIRKRQRLGDIDMVFAGEAIGLFDRQSKKNYSTIVVDQAVLDTAKAVVDAHPLRGYDAVQLAACLVLSSQGFDPTFVSADVALCRAAASEGLRVFNPTI
jgi:predicted nucleic acid-binding protein